MSPFLIRKKIKNKCKEKNDCNFIMYGPGVEKIFDKVKKIFPENKVEIFSSDYMKKKNKQKLYLKKLITMRWIF